MTGTPRKCPISASINTIITPPRLFEMSGSSAAPPHASPTGTHRTGTPPYTCRSRAASARARGGPGGSHGTGRRTSRARGGCGRLSPLLLWVDRPASRSRRLSSESTARCPYVRSIIFTDVPMSRAAGRSTRPRRAPRWRTMAQGNTALAAPPRQPPSLDTTRVSASCRGRYARPRWRGTGAACPTGAASASTASNARGVNGTRRREVFGYGVSTPSENRRCTRTAGFSPRTMSRRSTAVHSFVRARSRPRR
jgi:hypothetical protein